MRHYPYLDLTVLPDIRELVISARATIIMNRDLSQIFWANGEGIELLGCQQVSQALETGISISSIMRRQIIAAIGRLGRNTSANASMRISDGWKSRLLNFTVAPINLPENEQAILLVTDPLHGRGYTLENMAASAVSCLAGSGYVSAVLDDEGKTIDSSNGYDDMALDREVQTMLVDEVASEDDRLVKRLVNTGGGRMAAGIARLADNPALHLLIVAYAEDELETSAADDDDNPEVHIDQDIRPKEVEEPKTDQEKPSAESVEEEAPPHAKLFSSRRPSLNAGDGGTSFQRWYYRQPGKEQSTPADDDEPAPQNSDDRDESVSNEATNASADIDTTTKIFEATEQAGTDLDSEQATSQHKLRLVNDDGGVHQLNDRTGDEDNFQFTAIKRPVRFAWRMDASNIFTTVSPELGQTIGPRTADIVEKSWADVAQAFEFDRDGSINARLLRGDTWSGKSVLWPVEGTSLRVPVDLAGLPSFDQNRNFSGYHGFGTIRTAETEEDPAKTGLALAAEISRSGEQLSDDTSVADVFEIDQPGGPGNREIPDETGFLAAGHDIDNGGGKIVDLKSLRKARADRELSVGEQAAFKEIAEKLSDAETVSGEKTECVLGAPEEVPAEQTDSTDGPKVEAQEENPFEEPASNELSAEANNEDSAGDYGTGNVHTYLPSAFAGLAVAENENIDTSILARLPIAVLIFKDRELLFSNQEFSTLTGYRDTDHLENNGGIEILLGNVDDGTGGYTRIIHEDGNPVAVKAHLQSVPWGGERVLLLALREDLDDRSRDVSSLIEVPENTPDRYPIAAHDNKLSINFDGISSSELSGILDTATDGVIVLNAEGDIRSINRAAEALFGYDASGVRGEKFTHLLARESHRVALDYFDGLSENSVASLLNDGREMIGKEAQGGLIPLFVTMGRLEESDGYCAVLRDITQWKKAEEDLVAARRQAELISDQKTDFLAKVSHEIRTPLNAIIGFSELMLEERFGKISIDRYREYLRDINRSGSHVLDLVNDLLDISKIEAGKLELDFSEVNLNDIVAEGVALTQPQANRDQIIIRTSLSGAVPPVVADPRSIRQIILNLVSNAIKYTRAGGQVIVSTVFEETGEVVLRVRDTGIGMSESEIITAMTPFHRVQTIAHHQGEGTGLGLPLTKALVEANLAQFSIESTPGVGTLVEMYIPSTRVLTE